MFSDLQSPSPWIIFKGLLLPHIHVYKMASLQILLGLSSLLLLLDWQIHLLWESVFSNPRRVQWTLSILRGVTTEQQHRKIFRDQQSKGDPHSSLYLIFILLFSLCIHLFNSTKYSLFIYLFSTVQYSQRALYSNASIHSLRQMKG